MRKRRPQKVCQCGHAKSRHHVRFNDIVCTADACDYCYDRCMTFVQDNLVTLERLNEFKENKEKESKEITTQISL